MPRNRGFYVRKNSSTFIRYRNGALYMYLNKTDFIKTFSDEITPSDITSHFVHSFKTDESIHSKTDLYKHWLDAIYDTYVFYNGFDSLEECCQYIIESPYERSRYIIVEFLDMYYAVIYNSSSIQLVCGKDCCYFTYNDFFISAKNPTSSLKVTVRRKVKDINPMIYKEMQIFDDNIRMFMFKTKNDTTCIEVDREEYINFIVLLGISMKRSMFELTEYNRNLLNIYFKQYHGYTVFPKKYDDVIAVDPFQRQLLLKNGQTEYFYTSFSQDGAWHGRGNQEELNDVQILIANLNNSELEVNVL